MPERRPRPGLAGPGVGRLLGLEFGVYGGVCKGCVDNEGSLQFTF